MPVTALHTARLGHSSIVRCRTPMNVLPHQHLSPAPTAHSKLSCTAPVLVTCCRHFPAGCITGVIEQSTVCHFFVWVGRLV